MTTLCEQSVQIEDQPKRQRPERRRHRRHDLERQDITVQRWDGASRRQTFGRIMDISAGGLRLRTSEPSVRADTQVRVRLSLPAYAGICPFVDTAAVEPQPSRDWVGWMAVRRVQRVTDREYEVAGSLLEMDDLDRGMLGLYLSTQPLAA